MRWGKKLTLITVLTALSVVMLLVAGAGCSQAEDSEDSRTMVSSIEDEESDDMLAWIPSDGNRPQMSLEISFDEIAEILGIDQQELEDAFAQAQSEQEIEGEERVAPDDMEPGEFPPEGMEPGEPPPEGEEPFEPPSRGMFLPQNLLARIAEILNIDQQELEDAFAQTQSNTP